MNPFGDILNQGKQLLKEQALMVWFNRNHPDIGIMNEVRIRSKEHTISAQISLIADPTPLQIEICDYRLVGTGSDTRLEFGEIKTSRSWINAALKQYLLSDNRRLKVPEAIRMVL